MADKLRPQASRALNIMITHTSVYPTYIVKLGFTGLYFIFLFLLLNIDCGYSLEPPH